MARLEVNRSGELEVFVRVIELGGFSAAARACGMTPSAVSNLVARLEQRLGTRLVNRSTRQLQLTPEGCVFYERGVRILADLAEAERCASGSRAIGAGCRICTYPIPARLFHDHPQALLRARHLRPGHPHRQHQGPHPD